MAVHPYPLWFDKSGHAEMIPAIPILRRLWPDSVYIFCKRRAIENVASRLKKFPAHDFERHCAGWAKTMAAWRGVRPELPPEIYLEVDQQDLIRDTEAISTRIAEPLEARRRAVARSGQDIQVAAAAGDGEGERRADVFPGEHRLVGGATRDLQAILRTRDGSVRIRIRIGVLPEALAHRATCFLPLRARCYGPRSTGKCIAGF